VGQKGNNTLHFSKHLLFKNFSSSFSHDILLDGYLSQDFFFKIKKEIKEVFSLFYLPQSCASK
jgi:hypothetical protein